jgi:hypothetical protein
MLNRSTGTPTCSFGYETSKEQDALPFGLAVTGNLDQSNQLLGTEFNRAVE